MPSLPVRSASSNRPWRVHIMAIIALAAGFLTPFLTPAYASSDAGSTAGDYHFSVATAFCENQTGGPLFGCTPWEGVLVQMAVEYPSQTFGTACTTVSPGTADARAATCAIDVPYGATVTVSIDLGQVPAGYVLQQDATQVWTAPDGPPDGEVGIPVFTLDLAEGSDDPGTGVPDTDGGAAQIVSGNCATGLGEVIANLSPVAMAQGEPVGQASAVEAASSYSTVAVGLDGIIDGPSAVVVYASGAPDAAMIACGDVGGVNDQDGELIVVLRPVNGSGFAGMARLAYNSTDSAMTDVTIYLGSVD
ncbi:MAG: hypothetical protein QM589_18460 [Thermomicrobiales bacterium]